MCGIAGKYNFTSREPVDERLLSLMCDSLRHRGPDDRGVYFDNEAGVGLGHRRLSIIDIATGHQPMSNAAGTLWIVYNGEIYNFKELREQQRHKGYLFRTNSDTEVILAMFEEYGERAFAQLNGIFACAIYNTGDRTITLARDHFGVKPLYYADTGTSFLFGSEVKAILAALDRSPALDTAALDSFLTFRYNPSPETLFSGIRKLEPGHCLVRGARGPTVLRPYRKYEPRTNHSISRTDAICEYQRLLHLAVKRQMISDVPVGLLLSGGLDSALIGRLMTADSSRPIDSFSIGFEGTGEFNELADAAVTAQLIGSRHHEATIGRRDYLDFFIRSFHHVEEPIAETTIPALYYLTHLASQSVKVVLAGQGADEPLAGYKRYIGARYLGAIGSLFGHLPIGAAVGMLPRNERMKRAAYALGARTEADRFLAIYTLFTPTMKEKLYEGASCIDSSKTDAGRIAGFLEQGRGLAGPLNRMLFVDVRMSLADNLLLFGDKMAMANSLEMRVPFLDLDVVAFLETLPANLKLRGWTGKYVHKQASERMLPPEIVYRKKRGFATPMDEWLQTSFAGSTQNLLNQAGSACSEYFNLAYINSLIDDHARRRQNYQRQIFALLSFELWHRTFIGGCSLASAQEILQAE
jgi:asparagine synthase (glutamine-hydrolysing)